MEKLNLYDKFFHSPNWANPSDVKALEKFRDILHDGYILSPLKMGKKSPYPAPCRSDCVYLSVHPNGNFGNMFHGKGYCMDYSNGYVITIEGSYIILSEELMRDYELEPGNYDCECTVLDQIELYKYLVGIGNAGYSIDDNLVLCFNLIKYFNGELEESELVKYIRERRLDGYISDRTGALINYFFTPCNNFLSKTMARSIESFIDIGNYYNILRILEEENRSIPLYDKYGYLIEPKKREEDVKMMYDYISLNLDLIDRDGTVDAMTGLVRHLEEKYKGTGK